MPETETIHATCIAFGTSGVLLLGPPGSGKSSLALRLIDEPGYGIAGTLKSALLVADDQVVLRGRGERLVASAPARLAGLLEIRGVGIVAVQAAPETAIVLAVQLQPATAIARLPDAGQGQLTLLGRDIPQVAIDAGLASAPSRLRAAFDMLQVAH